MVFPGSRSGLSGRRRHGPVDLAALACSGLLALYDENEFRIGQHATAAGSGRCGYLGGIIAQVGANTKILVSVVLLLHFGGILRLSARRRAVLAYVLWTVAIAPTGVHGP